MQLPVYVTLDRDFYVANARLIGNAIQEIPATDSSGKVFTLLDEQDIAE
jgi:hypothetical protein